VCSVWDMMIAMKMDQWHVIFQISYVPNAWKINFAQKMACQPVMFPIKVVLDVQLMIIVQIQHSLLATQKLTNVWAACQHLIVQTI